MSTNEEFLSLHQKVGKVAGKYTGNKYLRARVNAESGFASDIEVELFIDASIEAINGLATRDGESATAYGEVVDSVKSVLRKHGGKQKDLLWKKFSNETKKDEVESPHQIDKIRVGELKVIIGGLQIDAGVKRQAWIEYGAMLLECPFKQGAQIGKWVKDQGLDFVEGPRRSDAKKLAELTLRSNVKLDDCPCSTPTEVLRWLRDQENQKQEEPKMLDATPSQELVEEDSFVKAITTPKTAEEIASDKAFMRKVSKIIKDIEALPPKFQYVVWDSMRDRMEAVENDN